MKINLNNLRIFIKPGRTDMRKQINGLSAMVENEFKKDPMSGNLFLFCGRGRKNLKIIYWDKNGFCLWQKKLVFDKFPWPDETDQNFELTKQELEMLLSGIDFFHKHREVKFRKVS